MSQGQDQRCTPSLTSSQVPTIENQLLLLSPDQSGSNNSQCPIKNVGQGNCRHPPSYEKDGSFAIDCDLPPGWNRVHDPDGKEYFVNSITHVTQWEHPAMGSTPYHEDGKMSSPAHESTISFPNTSSGMGATTHEDGPTDKDFTYDQSHNLQATSHLITSEQLDDVPYRTISLSKYDKNTTCGQAASYIVRNNIILTAMSLIIWCLVMAGISIFLATRNEVGLIIPMAGGGLFYFWYCLIFICIAECPSAFLREDRTQDFFLPSERVLDTLRAKAVDSSIPIVNTIEEMVRADPHLEILLDCYHTVESITSQADLEGKPSIKRGSDSRITYQMKRRIPIIQYKDISVQPSIMGDIIDRCPSNTIHVTYNYTYQLHPAQVPVLEGYMKQLYCDHAWRDESVDIAINYCVPSYEDKQPDLFVEEPTGSQRAWRALCFHRCSFWMMAWPSLYVFYLILWRRFIKTIEYESVKYLHIGLPNPKEDEVVYSVPCNKSLHKYDEELHGKNNPQLIN